MGKDTNGIGLYSRALDNIHRSDQTNTSGEDDEAQLRAQLRKELTTNARFSFATVSSLNRDYAGGIFSQLSYDKATREFLKKIQNVIAATAKGTKQINVGFTANDNLFPHIQ